MNKFPNNSAQFSLDAFVMHPDQRPPAYIYIVSIILALPATWLIVGVAGEDVPGMIAMVVTIVLIVAISAGLNWLRLTIQKRSR